ncbi:MscL family protein [Flexivirga caeni]|uniref:MscL family protein n=1 Tax=Flexivirga caeni TaxID=2294115 RepID=A0A3M9ME87_9MICO|nr:MscL family protein [Flexivirga caeni]RNI23880.1 MscL family protein [Flexivirga caeni]
MAGFKKFLMQGNLVQLAVAFVIGAAFSTVVKAFTAMIMDLIGKLGGTPNFSSYQPGGVHVGDFITAVITFVIVAAVIYFGVVKPYEAYRERFAKEEEAEVKEIDILAEIRDELRAR